MLTGELRSKVNQLWLAIYTGGISNPLSVIEQVTYLLFAKRLDDLHTAKEAQANLLKETQVNFVKPARLAVGKALVYDCRSFF